MSIYLSSAVLPVLRPTASKKLNLKLIQWRAVCWSCSDRREIVLSFVAAERGALRSARRPSAAGGTLGVPVRLTALSHGRDTGKIQLLITFCQGSCLTLGSGNSEINGFGGRLRIFN